MAESLVRWFEGRRRDLPWRRTRDPYAIWVSEVMLQQTRVDQATPYYERFLGRFPTVAALAGASEGDVLAAFRGLGYYARARHLHRAAREVVVRFGGEIPREPDLFRSLPGVGEYTAGAVLSMAFGVPLPAIDGNAVRVLSRLLLIEGPPGSAAVRRNLREAANALVASGDPGLVNQALMELGALVCVPESPRCGDCPLARRCEARRRGVAASLPSRKLKAERPVVARLVGCLAMAGGFLLRRRAPAGLLASMIEFPGTDGRPDLEDAGALRALARHFREALGIRTRGEPRPLVAYQHTFSHLHWEVRAYRLAAAGPLPRALPEGVVVASPEEMGALAIPVAFRPIVRLLGGDD